MAGYPAHHESDVILRDGSTLRLRPARPEDSAALRDLPYCRGAGAAVTGHRMTRDDIRAAVLQALTSVARAIDPQTLAADAELRHEYDLDSMDFLNFVIAVHDTLGVTVPDTAGLPR